MSQVNSHGLAMACRECEKNNVTDNVTAMVRRQFPQGKCRGTGLEAPRDLPTLATLMRFSGRSSISLSCCCSGLAGCRSIALKTT
jgi:hypothetical protein